ncbi:divergent polysaccharide deacetylase family protein [Motiliproteus sp. SC1-56]|uniref:divergent polysaccharide deacetylase family protein n=1 Tax=Motiliproteus sp. SC1-56 TaxID=2799565 RepID=UPI001A8FBB0B|nr:divergent polysaccharide deacetylase family protein [Motiliproteus sp. SC1-56]
MKAALLTVLIAWALLGPRAEAGPGGSVEQPAIVIVIDDMGDNLARGEAAVSLPGPVTFAILPHSPFGTRLANQASASGKDVILHAPMENRRDRPLGPGGLTRDLSPEAFLHTLQRDLDAVPQALGLNNHMGSLLTTLEPQMAWVMEELARRGLFFLDSRTAADSVAWRVARDRGIPYLQRDVFLDHEQTPAFVHRQFLRTIEIAREHGVAIAIGHPYPVTVGYLKRALPLLDEMGIRLVSASALLMEQQEKARLAAYYRRQQARAVAFKPD